MSAEVDPQVKDLVARALLFKSYLSKQDDRMRFLPGLYGGPANSDRLAYYWDDLGQVRVFLGIKSAEPDGGLQLDADSLGGFVQFSKQWLEALILQLAAEEETLSDSQTIADSWSDGKLVTAVLLVRPGAYGNELLILRIETPDRVSSPLTLN